MGAWTEVKCYMCSRVCGEIPGGQPPAWVLFRVDRILPVGGCGVKSTANLHCSRCGGRVYPADTYVVDREKASLAA